MTLMIEKKYLICPQSSRHKMVAVILRQGGEIRDVVYTGLCSPEDSEFDCFLDVEEFIGMEMEITVERCESPFSNNPETEKMPEELASYLAYIRSGDQPEEGAPYQEPYRPHIHFTSKRGWINDPNGLIWHDGVYHLYYQHAPGALYGVWDNHHWGHAVSRDLFHWEEKAPALRYPCHGSGSGFVNRETGRVCVCSGPDIYQSEDGGFHFKRMASSLAGSDPKMFYYEPTGRYIVLTFNPEAYRFQVYSSADLEQWTLESELDNFFECPDLFRTPLVGTDTQKWILHGGDCAYRIGTFDGSVFTPDPLEPDRLDVFVPNHPRSASFKDKYNGIYTNDRIDALFDRLAAYSGQTFANQPDGRIIRMLWYRIDFAKKGMPFTQCMTIPHELTLRATGLGVRLCALPVKEIENLYGEKYESEGPCASIHVGDGVAFDCSVDIGPEQSVRINDFQLCYSERDKRITVSQTAMPEFSIPYVSGDGRLRVRAVLDIGCAEIFFGCGEIYLPLRPNPDVAGLTILAEADSPVHAVAYALNKSTLKCGQ